VAPFDLIGADRAGELQAFSARGPSPWRVPGVFPPLVVIALLAIATAVAVIVMAGRQRR
jgi:hypothetical protein